MAKPPRRPLEDIGIVFRAARTRAKLSQAKLAKLAKMRPAQVSLAELGFPVESKFYWMMARALDYPSVSALLRARQEPETRKLMAMWEGLEESERRRLLRKIEGWL